MFLLYPFFTVTFCVSETDIVFDTLKPYDDFKTAFNFCTPPSKEASFEKL